MSTVPPRASSYGWSPRTSVSPSIRARRKRPRDRKSTRLNSSHQIISYAVFCLKKKKKANPKHGDSEAYFKKRRGVKKRDSVTCKVHFVPIAKRHKELNTCGPQGAPHNSYTPTP